MDTAQPINDRYRLVEQIGEGAWAWVWRGHDLHTGAAVAIKILKHETLFNLPNAVERFNREAQVLRQINHPRIVHVYEAIATDTLHCIIMEYVAGGSLQDRIASDAPLAVGQAVRWAWQTADALAPVHALHVVHRDIKPSNILFAADGTLRLTDFGIARWMALESITATGMPMGTTHYLAPETLRGERADERADLWALGVVLYEMLAGSPPFNDRKMARTMMAIINDPVPDVCQRRPDCPPELARVLLRLLEKDRTARYASVLEVCHALAPLLPAE